jgi:hypothetical protein
MEVGKLFKENIRWFGYKVFGVRACLKNAEVILEDFVEVL